MNLVDFLSKLDDWVIVSCGLLLILFLGFFSAMVLQSVRAARRINTAADALNRHRPQSPNERRFGRSLEVFEQVQQAGSKLAQEHAPWWSGVEAAVEKYESPDGQEGYFLTRHAREIITLEQISQGYNGALYHAVPGVLTSLGLLGTFIAILVGLDGLSMDPTAGTVSGLDSLITSLSGKFLTSIVALGLSVLFLLGEVGVCQPHIHRARRHLVTVIGEVLPFLSPSRILLDIQRHGVKQAESLSNISADVVDKFANVFRGDLAPVFAQGISASMASQLQSEMGPTLSEIRTVMQGLTETVSRLEESKQESVVGELQGLIEALSNSLQRSLSEMGHQFHTALTGSTQQEFGQLADIIGGSARVVEEMNTNFTLLQSALQSVIEEAKASTSAQMSAGVEQTNRLNLLVEGLMTRLNETASSNYQELSSTLTDVVSQLSERVTQLSSDLLQTVGSAAAHSQAAVETTIKHADAWTVETSHRLDGLLQRLELNAGDFDKAGQTLLAAQSTLQATLQQNNQALAALGAAASEVKIYTTSLAGIQKDIRDGQASQAQVVTLSRESVTKLVESADLHRDFLAQYHTTFEQYRRVFDGLDVQLGRVLETILDRMQQYNRSVEANFQVIVESANNVMPTMASVLKAETEVLQEHLEELNSVLEKGTARIAMPKIMQ